MKWMGRWWRDTLFRRLFILLWVTLVGSHLLAFWLVSARMGNGWGNGGNGPDGRAGSSVFSRLPILPSLPPTPGMPDGRQNRMPGPGFQGPGGPGEPGARPGPPPGDGEFRPMPPPQMPPMPSGGRRGLSTSLLVMDYGVRLVIIALAAWLGAAWLSRPMRQLSAAARAMGESLQRDTPPPRLDEHQGTLEVRDTAQVFNQMASQLQEQFKARGLLVAAISHDLRTPLTRMRLRLESLEHEPQAQRCIADVHEMDALIDSVLQVFRGAHAAEDFSTTDVLALAQSLADDLVEQGQVVAVHGGTALARAQPAALRRVLSNLLSNALRYGERAEVMVSSDDRGVLVRIDDFGPGIPAAQLEDVFQPFYRVESSRNRATGGTGLGLYIARDLVTRQGGQLTLANRPEGGLRAELRLRGKEG